VHLNIGVHAPSVNTLSPGKTAAVPGAARRAKAEYRLVYYRPERVALGHTAAWLTNALPL